MGPSSGRLNVGSPLFVRPAKQIDFFAIFPIMFVKSTLKQRYCNKSCMAMEMPIFGLPLNIQIGNEDSVRERTA